jgi:hypothetical protein
MVWSGFFYPHENIDSAYRKTIPLDLMLVSAKKMDEDDEKGILQDYTKFVGAKGLAESASYAQCSGDKAIDQVFDSVWRVNAMLLESRGDDSIYLKVSKRALRRDWQFSNVIGIMRIETSVGWKSVGVGWIRKTALANALSPGLMWQQVILT